MHTLLSPKTWIGIGLLLLSLNLFAQQKQTITFTDSETGKPIPGVNYQYNDQSGTSDAKGEIGLVYLSGNSLQLSHISYGKWTLSDTEVLQALEQGNHPLQMQLVTLYPVTVIALHGKPGQGQGVELDYKDQMAHDAGAILGQSVAISTIRKSGGYGFDPVLRGFKYDQLNIVIDGGQSAIAACPNRMDPPTSQIAPNMIQRIEILKGPHALRYGNGFGGTINFVSAPTVFTASQNVSGRLSGSYESNGLLPRSEGQLGFTGQWYNVGLFGSWSQGNDYLSGDGTTIPSNFLRESFGIDAGLKINPLNQVRITTTYNRARNSDFPSLPMDLISDDTWLFNAKHEYRPTRGHLTKLSTNAYASLVDHIMSNELKSLDPRMVNAITEAQTFNLGGRTEALWNVPNGLLYTGADLRMDGAEGIREREFLMGPNAGRVFLDNVWQTANITKTAFFAEYQLGQGNWQWVLATRLEANQATSNEPADQFTGLYESSNSFQFNPSVSMGSIYRLNSEMAISGWLGRAQRSGGLTEKFINFFPVGLDPYELVGNPELKPEVNNQLDLGWQWKSGGNGINIDVFASWLQNYISGAINPDIQPRLPASPGVRQFTNIGEAFKTGFEIQWAQQLWEGISQQVSVAYTYGQDVEKDQPLPEIAPLDARYQLFAGFLNNRLQPEISFRYVLDQERISLEYGEKSTPSFAILDIRASWQVISNLKITAGINNLLDQNYYEHLSRSINSETPIYAPGRSFVASFNVVF